MAGADTRAVAEPREQRRGDAGYSLTEIVVTVALLGIVVVPVLGAVRGSVKASAVSRAAAQVETALVNAAEAVNRASLSCDPDDYREAIGAALADAPNPVRLTALDVTHAGGPAGTPCPGPSPTFDLVQHVRIGVTSADGELTRSLSIVKSHV